MPPSIRLLTYTVNYYSGVALLRRGTPVKTASATSWTHRVARTRVEPFPIVACLSAASSATLPALASGPLRGGMQPDGACLPEVLRGYQILEFDGAVGRLPLLR